MKIFIIGYMGAGKSSMGKAIAPIFNFKHIDLDIYIEKNLDTTIQKIFNSKGEEYFRKVEHNSLKKIIENEDNFILSVGGGTSVFFDNMEMMKKSGITVYLKLNPKVLLSRLLNSRKKRPLIEKLSKEELLDYIIKNLEKREHYYNQANLIIDSLNLNKKYLAEKIYQYIEQNDFC